MYDDLFELAQDLVLCSFLAGVVQASLGYLDDVELHVELDVAFVPTSSHVTIRLEPPSPYQVSTLPSCHTAEGVTAYAGVVVGLQSRPFVESFQVTYGRSSWESASCTRRYGIAQSQT